MYGGLVRQAGRTLIFRLSHLPHFMRLAKDGTEMPGIRIDIQIPVPAPPEPLLRRAVVL